VKTALKSVDFRLS